MLTKLQQMIKEKLVNDHWSLWMKEREKQWNIISDKYPVICICGKLCTGLHENYCRKFQESVDKATIKSLKNIIDLKDHVESVE